MSMHGARIRRQHEEEGRFGCRSEMITVCSRRWRRDEYTMRDKCHSDSADLQAALDKPFVPCFGIENARFRALAPAMGCGQDAERSSAVGAER